MKVVLLVLALALGLAAGAVADPCVATSAGCVEQGAAAPSAHAQDDGPSLISAVLRLLGSVVVIGILLVLCVTGYRKLVQRGATRPGGMLGWVARTVEDRDPDQVRIGSRRYLGARESVAVVHAGGERFLVGISAAGITLISRLEPPATTVIEPEPASFAEALARVSAPAPDEAPIAERALRAAVERSRMRLTHLGPLGTEPENPRA